MGNQLSFFKYENSFLSEFEPACYWNCNDFTSIYLQGYEVNRRGQVRSTKTGKLKVFSTNRSQPYHRSGFIYNGKKITSYLHRIVACTFIKCYNREKYCTINHIDEDKTNNHYTNLEWTNNSGNMLAFAANRDKNQLKLL